MRLTIVLDYLSKNEKRENREEWRWKPGEKFAVGIKAWRREEKRKEGVADSFDRVWKTERPVEQENIHPRERQTPDALNSILKESEVWSSDWKEEILSEDESSVSSVSSVILRFVCNKWRGKKEQEKDRDIFFIWAATTETLYNDINIMTKMFALDKGIQFFSLLPVNIALSGWEFCSVYPTVFFSLYFLRFPSGAPVAWR